MNEKAKILNVNANQEHRINEIRELFSGVYNFLEEDQFWVIKGITREKESEE